MKKYVRKITKKTKYTYSIVLPKEIIDGFGWQDVQKIEVCVFGKNKILISLMVNSPLLAT